MKNSEKNEKNRLISRKNVFFELCNKLLQERKRNGIQ